MTDESRLDSVSHAGGSSLIDAILLRCESAWRRGERPDIDDVIQAHPNVDRRLLLVDLIHLELEQRLAIGELARVEEYLEKYPHLRADEITVLGLIQSEVEMRRRHEPGLSAADFCQRFPDLAVPIQALFIAGPARSLETDDTQDWTTAQEGSSGDGTSHTGCRYLNAGSEELSDHHHSTEQRPATGSRYTVLRPHARGGLGQVFVALDEELHREVAVKQLQPRYAQDTEYRARFVSEATITGALEHPGIVPVYGLGKNDDGCPYYAMRFIRGDSFSAAIDKYHKASSASADSTERSLEFRKLVARMVDVCNAVAYAHSRGVIHRDLKPANVMIGDFGETLVVDWGLAKSIEVTATQSPHMEKPLALESRTDSSETRIGSTVGTLQYMSPEQAAGRVDLVGVLSDVYCLGSTFYHLLTGKPYLGAGTFHTLVHRIQQGEFDRPRAINATVPPALEAICLKAMAKEPTDRYPTPKRLAEDIERWLADEPVSAYPETYSERTGRWLRKHRTWALSVASALFLVSAISVAAALLVNQARRNEALERRKAEEAKREAIADYTHTRETVDTLLTGAGDALKYYPEMRQLRAVLLKQAAASYDRLALRHDDPSLELERGRSYVRQGDIYRLLGDLAASDQAYLESSRIFEALTRNSKDKLEASIDHANVRIKRSLLMVETVKSREAEAELAATIADLEDILGIGGNRVHEAMGTALLNAAILQGNSKDFDTAISSLREAIHQFDLAGRDRKSDPRFLISKATAKGVWGQCLVGRGQYAGAIEQYEAALSDLEQLPLEPLVDSDWLDARAALRIGLASAFRLAGRYTDELESYQSAIGDYMLLDDATPHAPPVVERLALTRTDMGQLLHHLGDASAARAQYQLALAAFESLHIDFPNVPRYHQELASTVDSLGDALRDLGKPSEAQLKHAEAIQAYTQLIQHHPEETEYRVRQAICHSHLGQALHDLGSLKEASDAFQASLALLNGAQPQTLEIRDARCFVQVHQGKNLLQQGDRRSALESFQAAIDEWQEVLKVQEAPPEFYNHLAWFLVVCPETELRDANRAGQFAEEALKQAPFNPVYLSTLAAAKYRQGKADEAIEVLDQIIQIRGRLQGREWFIIAMAQHKAGNLVAASDALHSGEQWLRDHLPGSSELKQLQAEAQSLVHSR